MFDYTGTSDPLALGPVGYWKTATATAGPPGTIYSTTAASNGWALGYVDNGTTITVMPALRGDANLDGSVDINDLTIVLAHYDQTGTTWSPGRFHRRRHGGHQRPDHRAGPLQPQASARSAAGHTAVPEPSRLALLAAGLAGLLAFACEAEVIK